MPSINIHYYYTNLLICRASVEIKWEHIMDTLQNCKVENSVILCKLSMAYNLMERTIDSVTQDVGSNPSYTPA